MSDTAEQLRLAEATIERLTADLDHAINSLGAAVLRAERAEEALERAALHSEEVFDE